MAHRLRTQFNYDNALTVLSELPLLDWEPGHIKKHKTRSSQTPPLAAKLHHLPPRWQNHRPLLSPPEHILIWVTTQNRPGDFVRRDFRFADGVPPEYEWMVPDPAKRIPDASATQAMPIGTWIRLYCAERLTPGVILDYTKYLPPEPAPTT